MHLFSKNMGPESACVLQLDMKPKVRLWHWQHLAIRGSHCHHKITEHVFVKVAVNSFLSPLRYVQKRTGFIMKAYFKESFPSVKVNSACLVFSDYKHQGHAIFLFYKLGANRCPFYSLTLNPRKLGAR